MKVESSFDRTGLIVHTTRLDGELFAEGSKGYVLLIYKSEHTGAHVHNIPLMVAPVHFTNFKNFHFRKWCVKKDETDCSTYNVIKESDSRLGYNFFDIFETTVSENRSLKFGCSVASACNEKIALGCGPFCGFRFKRIKGSVGP